MKQSDKRNTILTWALLALLGATLDARAQPVINAPPSPGSAPVATPVATPTPEASGTGAIEFDRIERTTLYFRPASIRPITLDLYDATYLGTLRSDDGKTPYFLFRGRTCADCIQDLAIHVIRPGSGRVATFVFPGKLVEAKKRQVVLESRAFVGKCLRGSSSAYVAFQKERVDKKPRLQLSVFVAEPGPDHLDEKLLERRLPRIQDTLHYVRTRSCLEIEGRNRIPISRPLSQVPRVSSGEGDDEESDDSTKENQTDGDLSTAPGHE